MGLLHQLRALGVRLAMDDFGTGYSALSYLPRFPFDKIKIDRCFLQDRAISERSGRMLEAIAAMAGTLKIAMTVEGVENSGAGGQDTGARVHGDARLPLRKTDACARCRRADLERSDGVPRGLVGKRA